MPGHFFPDRNRPTVLPEPLSQADTLPEHDVLSIDQQSAKYAERVIALLHEQLCLVVEARQATILSAFRGEAPFPKTKSVALEGLLQAWGIWFQLLSIAEENTGMRRRRLLEKHFGAGKVPGTFAYVLHTAQARGMDAESLRERLHRAHIRPTLTAHPTEAKRITVLEIHRRIYVLLFRLESDRWTQREREQITLSLRNEIDLLWLTGELRLQKPTVEQEIAWGLHFFSQTLYEQVPVTLQNLQRGLDQLWPDKHFTLPPFFQFGSWIGGDRDGNPLVTPQMTRKALQLHRSHALRHYVEMLRDMARKISVAQAGIVVSTCFTRALDRMLLESGAKKEIIARNPGEVFRQFVRCMLMKMENTLRANLQDQRIPESGYPDANAFIHDLQSLWQGLTDGDCRNIADALVLPCLHKARVFRFCTAALDIRENSIVINHSLSTLWHTMQGAEAASSNPTTRQAQLLAALQTHEPLPPTSPVTDETTETTLALFRLIAEQMTHLGQEAFGGFILSMTRSVSDILAVYLLGKYTGLFTDTEKTGQSYCRIPIVPLFETIEDLQQAPAIMQELLSIDLVQRSVQQQGGIQEVMIGYSDSNKDGGFFTANQALYQVQENICAVTRDMGVTIRFFHGRGGSVSRGGVPTGRAISAQPNHSIHAQLRITEQGEVVSSKYANEGTAQYQMELLACSVFMHGLNSREEPPSRNKAAFDEAMELLSQQAYRHYRCLTESEGLLRYYQIASPVEELGKMNIGSRPARRFRSNNLNDLRAIPWVFAWTQNRHMVPGWYGVGQALAYYRKAEGKAGEKLLAQMFEKSRLFRLIIDEVEKTLGLVDMVVCEQYAGLVEDQALRESIFGLVRCEYERTVQEILRLTGEDKPCTRFRRFNRKLNRRFAILRQAGCEQVALLRHYRDKTHGGRTEDLMPLLLSINCVSSGFGWTG